MVVDDLYIVSVAVSPYEAEAPPVIDANAVLSCPIAR